MAAATAAGCSKSEPGLVPVRGKITLDGGPWPHEGSLIFTPEGGGPGARSRPAGARFGTDGAFVATSFAEGDGLFPGTYKISVECWEAEPKMANNGMVIDGKNAVPSKYQSTVSSGLDLTVNAGGPLSDVRFDVKRKP